MWVWYADRGTALVAYGALWVSVLTGMLYNARAFAWLQEASRRIHTPASVAGLSALLLHVVVGTLDAWLVVAGKVPPPGYSNAFFLVGVFVGVLALLLLATSVLGFLDARRFQRPWDPRAVHALSYGAFAFASIHAVAVGSDLAWSVVAGTTGLLVYVLTLRAINTSPIPQASDRRADP